MADGTHIEWTEATWSPITGCSVVSPGCTNCYAMRLAGTRLRHHPSRAGLTVQSKAGPVWNGQVRLNGDWLEQPLRWSRPRMIFVCAHGDLFHENVPDDWIDRVFAVMALAPQHTYQVLTKRSGRVLRYINERCVEGALGAVEGRAKRIARDRGEPLPIGRTLAGTWPWPHVWLGVSVEDQTRADERIPELLATPAAVRWISAEPLIGPVNLRRWLTEPDDDRCWNAADRLHWLVCGGESGRGARGMDLIWARSLRDQCDAASVPFFMKQMGGSVKARMASIPSDLLIREYPAWPSRQAFATP